MPNIKKGYGPFIVFFVKIGDFLILNLIIALVFSLFEKYGGAKYVPENHQMFYLIANLCYAIALSVFGVKLANRVVFIERIVINAFYIASLHFILMVCCSAFLAQKVPIHILFISSFSVLFCIFLICWRVSMRLILKYYRKKGKNFINVVIIGNGESAKHLYEEMKTDLSSGFKIMGYLSNEKSLLNDNDLPPYLGNLDNLETISEKTRIDEIYYTLPITTGTHLRPVMQFCKMNMISFFVVPDFNRILKRKIDLIFLDDTPLFKIGTEPLAKRGNRFTKRFLDLVFAVGIIIFTYPFLFIVFGTIIKLTSKGPILFKQERTGLRGENFMCYKFRSMTKNKDADKVQATKGDKRVTRIGAFLRKTNLDEMPQFINVIKGDMSVVGPRPHMKMHTELYSKLIDRYMFRHMVKPGITGWAQVNGYRGETKELQQMEGRVERDVWYIENWSVMFDIKIILHTVWNVIKGEKNAY